MNKHIDRVQIPASKVLEVLIDGPLPSRYSVRCETRSDEDLLENRLPTVADLLGDLAYSMFEVSDWKDDHRYSAKACGQYAYKCIRNHVLECLDYLDIDDAKTLCRDFLRDTR